MANPICLRLFLHCRLDAASRTFCTAGNNKSIRMAIIAITTNNSISETFFTFKIVHDRATFIASEKIELNQTWAKDIFLSHQNTERETV